MRYIFYFLSLFLVANCSNPLLPNNENQQLSLRATRSVPEMKGTIQMDANGNSYIIDSKGRRIKSICSVLRLEGGYELYEYSKKYLANYFKTRNLKELFIAWYFSEDSNFLALSVRKCPDKKNKHFYALKTLLRKNAAIQDLITVNMRTKEYATLAEIYIDEYYELFPKEIK